MTPRRRAEYAKLDEVGFDVIEAILSKEGSSADKVAREYGVSEFNLRLWRRFRRTELYCEEIDEDVLLMDLAEGETLASIARANDLSYQIFQKWAASHVPLEVMEHARGLAADSQFERTKEEVTGAGDAFQIQRAMTRHAIEKFQAERLTRKYTDERQIRIQAPSGVQFSINTGHLDPLIAQPPPKDEK